MGPVCSPALRAARGRPGRPADLHPDSPLLYDLGWDADWSYWFARLGQPPPDLAQGLGLPPLQHAGTGRHGLGVAVGRPVLIARELESRTLVPVFDRQAEAPLPLDSARAADGWRSDRQPSRRADERRSERAATSMPVAMPIPVDRAGNTTGIIGSPYSFTG